MGSIASCVKEHAPPELEASLIDKFAKQRSAHMKQAVPGREAKVLAVQETLAELKAEKDDILAQIAQKRPAAPVSTGADKQVVGQVSQPQGMEKEGLLPATVNAPPGGPAVDAGAAAVIPGSGAIESSIAPQNVAGNNTPSASVAQATSAPQGVTIAEQGGTTYELPESDLQRPGDPAGATVAERAGSDSPLSNPGSTAIFTAPGQTPVEKPFQVHHAKIGSFKSDVSAVTHPREVADVLSPLSMKAQETVMALVTDDAGKPLSVIQHTIGGPASTQMFTAQLLGAMHNTKGGTKVWLAHNHPSGNSQVSAQDLETTTKVNRALDGTGIELLGQVVLTPQGDTSYITPDGKAYETGKAEPPKGLAKPVKVVERQIKGNAPNQLPGSGIITGSKEMIKEVRTHSKGQTGVLLLDRKRAPVAFIPITAEEMTALRKGEKTGAAARLYREFDKHASVESAGIASTDAVAPGGLKNLATFLKASGLQVFEVVTTDDAGTSRAATDAGVKPMDLARADDVFFSQADLETKEPNPDRTAEEVEQNIREGYEALTGSDDILFSIHENPVAVKQMEKSLYETIREALPFGEKAQKKKIQAEAEKQVREFFEKIAGYHDYLKQMREGREAYPTMGIGQMTQNSDPTYRLTVDLVGACVRMLRAMAIHKYIREAGKKPTSIQMRGIEAALNKHGFDLTCMYCYAFTRRTNAITKLEEMKSALESGAAPSNIKASSAEKVAEIKKLWADALTEAKSNPAWSGALNKLSDLTAIKMPADKAALAKISPAAAAFADTYPAIWALKQRVTDAGNMKMPTADLAVAGQIANLPPDIIRDLKLWGGLRWQSSVDFIPAFAFDYIQGIAEMAFKDIPGHVYTKEIDLVRLMGDNGLKINLSAAPVVRNEKVVWDTERDMPMLDKAIGSISAKEIDEAMLLAPDHAGVMMLGVNDEILDWITTSDSKYAHYSIPWHASGMPALISAQFKAKNVIGAIDYTDPHESGKVYANRQAVPKHLRRLATREINTKGQPTGSYVLDYARIAEVYPDMQWVADAYAQDLAAYRAKKKVAKNATMTSVNLPTGPIIDQVNGTSDAAATEAYFTLLDKLDMLPQFESYRQRYEAQTGEHHGKYYWRFKKHYARTDTPFAAPDPNKINFDHAKKLDTMWQESPLAKAVRDSGSSIIDAYRDRKLSKKEKKVIDQIVTEIMAAEGSPIQAAIADWRPAGRKQATKTSAANQDNKGIYINDDTQAFTDQILSGAKTIETRDNDRLKSYVGRRVGIIKSGKGKKASLVGYVTITEMKHYPDEAAFRKDDSRHLVAKDSDFDIKKGGQKYGFVLDNPVRLDTPIPMDPGGRIAKDLGDIPKMSTSTELDGKGYDQQAAQKTQRANTISTYRKVAALLDALGIGAKRLDYGAGLTLGSDVMRAESYEPMPRQGVNPTYTNPMSLPVNTFDGVVSQHMLNVVPDDIRGEAIKHIGSLLKRGGTAIIITRGRSDVSSVKTGRKLDDEAEVITGTGTYQRGFSSEQLAEIVQETLGSGFAVEVLPAKHIGGSSNAGIKVVRNRVSPISVDYKLLDPNSDRTSNQTDQTEEAAETRAELAQILGEDGVQALLDKGVVRLIGSQEQALRIIERAKKRGTKHSVKYSKGGKVQGFTHGNRVYLVQDGIGKGKAFNILKHELGIHLRKAMLEDADFRALLGSLEGRQNENSATGRAIKAAMARVPKSTKPGHYWEEVLAYMVEAHPENSLVKQFIRKIKEILRKIGIDIKSLTVDDINELAIAAVQAEAGLVETLGPVDINSPKFKRWFGESVVVDADGAPQRVFHGTHATTIEAFRTSKELGAHFGSETQANQMASYRGGPMYPVYISIKNPLRLEDHGSFDVSTVRDQLVDHGVISEADVDTVLAMSERAGIEFLQDRIEAAGYDGIVYLNRREGKNNPLGPDGFDAEELNQMTDSEFMEEFPDAEDSYIAINPAQVKSAISNTGEFNPFDPNIQKSEIAPAWRSRLAEMITTKGPVSATAEQWLKTIEQWKAKDALFATQSATDKKTGEKKVVGHGPLLEELEWSGLEEYLEGRIPVMKARGVQSMLDGKPQVHKITRDEIVAFLGENGVQVEDVAKGRDDGAAVMRLAEPSQWVETKEPKGLDLDPGQKVYKHPDSPLSFVVEKENGESYEVYHDFDFVWEYTSLQEAIDDIAAQYSNEVDRGNISPITTQYHRPELNLPGGENYKELLITLPEKEMTGKEGPAGWHSTNSSRSREGDRNYRSSHWEEPNVLAHVRFDERTDADGKKVLFLEEVQSDWHQEGRKKGYSEPGLTRDEVEIIELTVEEAKDRLGSDSMLASVLRAMPKWREDTGIPQDTPVLIHRMKGESDSASGLYYGKRLTPDQFFEKHIQYDEDKWSPYGRINRERVTGAPDAPFKTSWPMLAIKRMIRYAAENGFDRIAWTTGEQQAERYQLSNHISRLAYAPSGKASPGTYDITAYDLNDNQVLEQYAKTPEELEGSIGKELTQKIVAGEGTPETDGVGWTGLEETPTGSKILSGLDLKVGGEGMKAFYDKMLPSAVTKFVKKWGAKAEFVDLGKKEKAYRVEEVHGEHVVVVGHSGTIIDSFDDRWDAMNLADRLNDEVQTVGRDNPALIAGQQPGFTVTPEMAASALGQGMPLFSKQQGRPATDTPAFKRWFGKSKVKTKSGQPVSVYHGSTVQFFAFDQEQGRNILGKDGKSPMAGLGHFFSVDQGEARGYAGPTGETREFFLKMEKPLVMHSWLLPSFKTTAEAKAYAKRQQELNGHDGIYFPDQGHFIAFDANHIKSATDNTGDFSLDSDDVRFSIADDTNPRNPAVQQRQDAKRQQEVGEMLEAILGPPAAAQIKARTRRVQADPDTGKKLLDKSRTAIGNISPSKVVKRFQGYAELVVALQNDKLDGVEKQRLLSAYLSHFDTEVRGAYGLSNVPAQLAAAKSNREREKILHQALLRINRAHEAYTKKKAIRQMKELIKKNAPKLKGSVQQQTVGGHKLYREIKEIGRILRAPNEVIEAQVNALTDPAAVERQIDTRMATTQPKENQTIEDLRDQITADIELENLLQLRRLSLFGGITHGTADEAVQALEALKDTISTKKIAWHDEMYRLVQERIANRIQAVDVVSGGKGLKREVERQKDQRRLEKTLPKLLDGLRGYDDKHQSFEWLLDKLSRYDTGSGILNSPIVQRYAKLVHRATRNETAGLARQMRTIQDARKGIYGLEGRALEKRLLEDSAIIEESGVWRRNETGAKIEQIPLSQNQAYKRWMEWQDPTLQDKLTEQGYDLDTMDEIARFLKPETRAWAEWQLRTFYPQYYGQTNEVFQRLFGTDMPFNPLYSPIKRLYAKGGEDSKLLKNVNPHSSVVASGVKNRVTSHRDLVLQDGDVALLNHIRDMEHFRSWAEPMRELRASLGSESVRMAIQDHHGQAALAVLDQFLDDFAAGKSTRDMEAHWLTEFRGRFTTAVIGLNPIVFLKQLTSIPAYAMEIPVADWVRYLPHTPAQIKEALQTLRKSEMIQDRYDKGFERDMIVAMGRTSAGAMSGAKKTAAKMMALVKLGDGLAIFIGGWPVYKYHLNKALAEGKPQREAEALAMEAFEMSTDRTQQAGNVKDMMDYQRGGPWARLFTMFMTAPSSYYRQWAGGWRNLLGKGTNKRDAAKRVAITHFVLPAFFQFVASGFKAPGDDEDFLKNTLLGPLSGLMLVRDLSTTLGTILTGGRVYAHPGQAPPFSTMSEVEVFVRHLKSMIKRPMNEWMTDRLLWETVQSGGTITGNLTGIPVGPVSRWGEGIADVITGDTDAPIRRGLGFSPGKLDSPGREYLRLRRKMTDEGKGTPGYGAVQAFERRRKIMRQQIEAARKDGTRDELQAARAKLRQAHIDFVSRYENPQSEN